MRFNVQLERKSRGRVLENMDLPDAGGFLG